jgi:hypothetical protein
MSQTAVDMLSPRLRSAGGRALPVPASFAAPTWDRRTRRGNWRDLLPLESHGSPQARPEKPTAASTDACAAGTGRWRSPSSPVLQNRTRTASCRRRTARENPSTIDWNCRLQVPEARVGRPARTGARFPGRATARSGRPVSAGPSRSPTLAFLASCHHRGPRVKCGSAAVLQRDSERNAVSGLRKAHSADR